MTEREFDQKIERAAANFERRVETAADHLDKTVNRVWNRSRLFRCVSRGTSLAAEVGLLLIAGRLADRGNRTAAAWCAGLSVVGLAADMLIAICFRRTEK